MRTLRFRAWDTVLSRWNYSIEIDCYGNLQEYKWNGSAFYAKYKNDYNEDSEDVSERFIICQFTGLLDKNGKEVYEGDVIKCNLNNNITKREYWHPIYKVIYRGLGFTLEHIGGDLDSDTADFRFKYYSKESVEVIGNTYQNPELI